MFVGFRILQLCRKAASRYPRAPRVVDRRDEAAARTSEDAGAVDDLLQDGVEVGLSDTARNVRIGWRLIPAGGGGFELNLDAIRQEVVDDAEAEHGVMLRSSLRW